MVLCAVLQVTNMFLMYIAADAAWIWMEPDALPSLQPVIFGARGQPWLESVPAHCAAERWGVQLPLCVRLGRTVTLAVRGGHADPRPSPGDNG